MGEFSDKPITVGDHANLVRCIARDIDVGVEFSLGI